MRPIGGKPSLVFRLGALFSVAGGVSVQGAAQDLPVEIPRFVRGDADGMNGLALEDPVMTLFHLFISEPAQLPCEDAADANDDGRVDVGDPVYLLFYLFGGEAPPPPPFPECGEDPPGDPLRCEKFWICGTGLIVNSLGMKLLPVPAGSYEMGSPGEERGRYSDELLHTVVLLCDFYLSETEVTQGQYLEVMGENPSFFNGASGGGGYGTDLRRPVESVSWFDAVEFCRRLSETEGRTYRLPYEAEWEYACRAGTRTRFWFGDVLECPDDKHWIPCPGIEDYMWSYTTSLGLGMPVGLKKPNPWGFYDIHGHVQEWCQDWYGPYPEGTVVNPGGPLEGTKKVARGLGDPPPGLRQARSARRRSGEPEAAGNSLGFRVVVEIPKCTYGD